MSDEPDGEDRDEHLDADDGTTEPVARETAPMSSFTARAAGTGAVVLVVGLLVTVAIPFVFV